MRRVSWVVAVFASLAALLTDNLPGITSPESSTTSVTVYTCAKDKGLAPTVQLDKRSDLAPRSSAVPQKSVLIAPGVWKIVVEVPPGHWYLWLRSTHCGAIISTTSLDGEPRSFLTALYPGNSGTIDTLEHFVAGSLPYEGDTEIYMSRDGSPVNALQPIIQGKYFYFDNVRGDRYVLIANVGAYQIAVPIDLTSSRDAGSIVRITGDMIRAKIDAVGASSP